MRTKKLLDILKSTIITRTIIMGLFLFSNILFSQTRTVTTSGGTANYHPKFITSTTIGNSNIFDKGRAIVLPSGKIFASQDTSDMKMDFGTSALPRWRADLYYNTNANSFIVVDTFQITLSKDASGVKHQMSIQLDDDGVELRDVNVADNKEGIIHLDTIRTRVYHTDSIALVSSKTSVSGNFQVKDGTEGTNFILQGDDEGNSTWVSPSSVIAGTAGAVGDIPSYSGTNVQSNIVPVATGYLLGSQGLATKPAWLQAATLNTSLTTPILIGGTGVGSSSEIRATSGVGSSEFIKFTGGNNGATEFGRFINGGSLLIGGTSALIAGAKLEIQYNTNATGHLLIQNSSNGTAAIAQTLIRNDLGASSNLSSGVTSSTFTASGIYPQNGAFIRTSTTSLNIAADNASGVIRFFNSTTQNVNINASGRTFFGGSTSATALVHLGPGTATANTAPLKGTAGTLLSTPESLAKETSAQGWYGTSVALNRYSEGGAIADFTSDANNTSTTETDLYSYTTKASTLAATGEKIIIKYSGTFNDITATSQVKVLFAGTTIFDSGALTVGSTGAWVIEAMIIRTGASTARAVVNMNTGTATTMVYATQTDLTGLTFTNTNILKVTGTAGGAGGGDSDITAKLGTIFWHGAANN